MNLDLLAMSAISISAFVVVTTMAKLLGGDRRQRITVGVLLGAWFVGVAAVGADGSPVKLTTKSD